MAHAPRSLDRRAFVRTLGVGTLGLLAAACAPAAPASSPTTAPAAKPTEAPAAKPTSVPAVAASPAASTAASPAAAVKPAASPVASPAVVASPNAALAGVQPLSPRGKLKIALNPQGVQSMLPQFIGVEKGYFQRAGLDVEVDTRTGSSATLLPLLAHGDLDIGYMAANPALYNQLTQGFDIKIIASMSIPKAGRLSDTWFCVLKEQADQIKTVQDLKGKTVEAAVEGSTPDFVISEVLYAAGLEPGKDVTITYRVKSPVDLLVIARNKGADVIGMFEPFATQAEQEGLVVKWKTYGVAADFLPWLQPSVLAASAQFVTNNRASLEKFLEVYLLASREVNASNGVWTDELVSLASSKAGVPPQVIKDQGAVPYYEPNGAVSLESLDKSQDGWMRKGLVKQKVDVQQIVDLAPLNAAVQRVSRAPA